ncbi:MAG TPA: selenide, water dikinase SelD, partial [Terriglobales bacterium]|nr:selenide, water dikinase SelD [Terriglobales bacterium]
DFFTPIVDDPFTFGQIAATNSLSDVYAMGARPLTALAMVCFPEQGDLEILEHILAGGLSKMIEAECTIIGGHSIRDDDTKFGYSVTGVVDPRGVLQNGGAKPGDRLIFTKALGTGVISTAVKKGVAEQSWIDGSVASMTTLNKTAAEVITNFRSALASRTVNGSSPGMPAAMAAEDLRPAKRDKGFEVHSLTDVTGFGLIGHLREMLLASEGVSAQIRASQLPLLDGALESIRAGHIPGGLKANREFAECVVSYEKSVTEELRTILFDPQTAGGLLAAVAPESADALVKRLQAAGVPSRDIGEVRAAANPTIYVSN